MRKLVWILPLVIVSACNSDNKANSIPVLAAASFVTETEASLMDQLMATDPDGDMLTYSLTTEPSRGTLELNANGDFVYQPEPEFTGNDSFIAQVTDGKFTVSATFSIQVNRASVSFLQYSKAAFALQETDNALRVNGRDFIQDAEDTADYAEIFP